MTSFSSKSVYSAAEEYSVTCRSDSELEYSDAQEFSQEYSECNEFSFEDSEEDSLTTFNITEDSDEEHEEGNNKEGQEKIDQCEKEETSQRWEMIKARGVVDSSILQGKTDD